MNQKSNPENKMDNQEKSLLDKAEAYIDDAAEKLHQSEAYRKAGKAAENVTKKIFRNAGRWWGKIESGE